MRLILNYTDFEAQFTILSTFFTKITFFRKKR